MNMRTLSLPLLAAAGMALLVASPVAAAPFSNAAKPAAAVTPDVQTVHYRSFGFRSYYRPYFYSYSAPRFYSYSGAYYGSHYYFRRH
jgi:hypothetical protein